MVNKSDKDFYGGASNFAYAACQWIEWMSEKNGRHIHHTLCGHGGERQFVKSGNCKVDSYEPTTETVYGFNGCKWHGYPCQPNRSARDEERYVATKRKEEAIKGAGYTLVTAWECEKPPKKRCYLRKEFRAYPHYIVFDFEALLQVINQNQTDDLVYVSKHIPVNVAIHDSLSKSPTFIEHEEPKMLVQLFVEELERRRALILEEVVKTYPKPNDFEMLSERDQEDWTEWVDQVAVIGFNSGKYDLIMIKEFL